MCHKYIFEKYTSNAFQAIGKRPFLQFHESEIQGIHPLRFVLYRLKIKWIWLPDLLFLSQRHMVDSLLAIPFGCIASPSKGVAD